ncbi:MAG TPA: ABC transporter transmembrane domain-containing protein, partial [Oscillospiraceae bacterium]|nr:ABC transporter transmembrane domain-containing protein [Oscillospiraceae bacterium]
MNLKLSFPSGVSDEVLESAVFSLPTDIDLSARKKDGHCLVTPDNIYIYSENKLISTYSIEDIEEFKCEQLIGCSMLCIKTDGRYIALCAFTQKHFLRYVEIVRLLEYYKRYGELLSEDTEDEPSCLHCGLPLNGAKECPYCAKKSALIVKLIKRMKPYKWMFMTSVGSAILLYLISIVAPYLQRLLIDDYIIPKNKYLVGFLGIMSIYMLLNFVRWIFEHINAKTSFQVATNYGRDLRRDLFEKTQRLSMTSISKRTAGELIKRVTNDASLLQDFITQNGKEMILDTMAVIILGVILFVLNFKLALLVLIPVPIVLIISARAFNVISIRYGKVWRHNSKASSLLHDILNGIRVVKTYGNEKREIEKYNKISLKWSKSSAHAETIWYLIIPMMWFVIGLGELAVLYFGGEMVLGKEIGLGELIQYTTYVAMIYQPLYWMVRIPRALSEASVAAGRVFEVLDEQGEVSDHDTSVDLDIKGDIKFENVFFGYKAYNPVLKDISCEIKQGEMIGLVGHSGVGKSTFTNLIMRLYDVTGGTIYIDGV